MRGPEEAPNSGIDPVPMPSVQLVTADRNIVNSELQLATLVGRSCLDEVVAAMRRVPGTSSTSVVERWDEWWRWSPAVRGGSYVLLRVIAQVLGVDHRRVVISQRSLKGGWTALRNDDPAEDWRIVALGDGLSTNEVRASIEGGFTARS